MKDKKTLAKLAVTGLLLAANMPAAMQAETKTGREVYMAVAGCGAGCSGGGGLSTDSTSGKTKSLGGTKSAEDVADADDAATPEKNDPSSYSGSTNGTGAKTTSGSYGNPNTLPKK